LEKNKRVPAAALPVLEPYYKEAHEKLAAEKANFKKGIDLADAGGKGGMGMEMGVMDNLRLLQKGGKIYKELEGKLSMAEMTTFGQVAQNSGVRKVSERAAGEYRMPAEGDSQVKGGKGAGEIMEAKFALGPE